MLRETKEEKRKKQLLAVSRTRDRYHLSYYRCCPWFPQYESNFQALDHEVRPTRGHRPGADLLRRVVLLRLRLLRPQEEGLGTVGPVRVALVHHHGARFDLVGLARVQLKK